MLKFVDGVIVDLTAEEEQKIQQALSEYKKRELRRPLNEQEAFQVIVKAVINNVNIPDQTSLRMKSYYPRFEEIAAKENEEDRKVKTGFKLTYNDELWKVRQNHTIQSIYPPSTDPASLYERIDEENDGTKENPIPYDDNMQVYKDLYYTYDGQLYLCIRSSGQPLYCIPSSLIGNYFEYVYENETEGDSTTSKADGTKENPYPYVSTTQVFKDIYYTYGGKVYQCIRDSENPLYNTPDSLIGIYFALVEES